MCGVGITDGAAFSMDSGSGAHCRPERLLTGLYHDSVDPCDRPTDCKPEIVNED